MHSGFSSLLDAAASTIGWVAAAAVLLAYMLLMTGRVTADSVIYLTANAAGSAGLALSMVVAHAWQPAVVNVLWLIFGIAPLVRALRGRLRRRASAGAVTRDSHALAA